MFIDNPVQYDSIRTNDFTNVVVYALKCIFIFTQGSNKDVTHVSTENQFNLYSINYNVAHYGAQFGHGAYEWRSNVLNAIMFVLNKPYIMDSPAYPANTRNVLHGLGLVILYYKYCCCCCC